MASATLASRVNGSRFAFSTRRNVAKPRPVRMHASVTIKTPEGEKAVEIDADTFILDAAEEAGLDLPYSCRAGACSSCAAKFVSGGTMDECIDLGEQSFLSADQIKAGYFLSCVAYIKKDCVIESHQEEKLY